VLGKVPADGDDLATLCAEEMGHRRSCTR
jgi:hypothetical protein